MSVLHKQTRLSVKAGMFYNQESSFASFWLVRSDSGHHDPYMKTDSETDLIHREPDLPNKKIIIIAGPNGAGKTTFARSFLPAEAGLPRFINARFNCSRIITLYTGGCCLQSRPANAGRNPAMRAIK